MKKEWVALVLMISILAGNLWNLHHMDTLSASLIRLTEEAYSAAVAEDWPSAAAAAENARLLWSSEEYYTHVFIRHPEIDSLTDEFCDLQGAVESRDSGEILGAYLSVSSRIVSILKMERPSVGSIL